MALQRHPGAAQVWLLKPDMTAGSASPELVAYVPILPVRGFGVARLPTMYPSCASYTEEAEC